MFIFYYFKEDEVAIIFRVKLRDTFWDLDESLKIYRFIKLLIFFNPWVNIVSMQEEHLQLLIDVDSILSRRPSDLKLIKWRVTNWLMAILHQKYWLNRIICTIFLDFLILIKIYLVKLVNVLLRD